VPRGGRSRGKQKKNLLWPQRNPRAENKTPDENYESGGGTAITGSLTPGEALKQQPQIQNNQNSKGVNNTQLDAKTRFFIEINHDSYNHRGHRPLSLI
jgi:hypothetical protein